MKRQKTEYRKQNTEVKIQNVKKLPVCEKKRQAGKTAAAVTTDKGVGAIATTEIFGKNAESVLRKIFFPLGSRQTEFNAGKILVGTIQDGKRIIDQVIIGCSGEEHFAVNCHGNPLIVSELMRLLESKGVKAVSKRKLLGKIFFQRCGTTIEAEGKLAVMDAQTVVGTKIILNQVNGGLTKQAKHWLAKPDRISLKKLKRQAEKILENSEIAWPIIYGCKIAIVGPPNTGKSTLLNCLAGRQKAIVTDIAGTTRDYITADCQIGPLFVQLIDTAGVGRGWRTEDPPAFPLRRADRGQRTGNREEGMVEKIAQRRSVKISKDADLVLLVLDVSQFENEIDKILLKKIAGKAVIAVLNKSDLESQFDIRNLPDFIRDFVRISALTGKGVDKLLVRIRQKMRVDNFDVTGAVCVTARQERLLRRLKQARTKTGAFKIIAELLNGRL